MSEYYKEQYLYNSKICNTSSFDESLMNNKPIVYEVIRLVKSKAFNPEDNYKRLLNSLKIAEINYKITFSEMLDMINLLAEINNVKQGNLKFIVFNKDGKPSSLMYFIKHHYPNEEEKLNGVKTMCLKEERKDPTAKVINNNLRNKANSLMEENDVFEVLLIDSDGFITEGSRSNLFFIKKDIVFTCDDKSVLAGTARKRTLEICDNYNIKLERTKVRAMNIHEYDAAFLTGTSLGVLPIAKINQFSFDVNNKTLRTIQSAYLNLLDKV
ncbi:MAG: aminotransferase class IV [Marinifilaceae bacterium]